MMISVYSDQWIIIPLCDDNENYQYWKGRSLYMYRRLFSKTPFILITRKIIDYTVIEGDFTYMFMPFNNHKKSYTIAFRYQRDRQRIYNKFNDDCYGFANGRTYIKDIRLQHKFNHAATVHGARTIILNNHP